LTRAPRPARRGRSGRRDRRARRALRALRAPPGAQGPKGDTGAQGIQGPQGVKGDTGPAGPVLDIHALSTAAGAFGNLNASWGLLPVGALDITQSVPGTPDFVANGDGSVTIKTAGLYSFIATAYINGGAAAAETLLFAVNLTVKAGNLLPTEADPQIGGDRQSEGPGNWSFPNRTAVGLRRCLVNDRVAVYGYAAASPAAAKPAICNVFSAVRLAA
jgi:hypothetical protein